jgi:hypothetical protein
MKHLCVLFLGSAEAFTRSQVTPHEISPCICFKSLILANLRVRTVLHTALMSECAEHIEQILKSNTLSLKKVLF